MRRQRPGSVPFRECPPSNPAGHPSIPPEPALKKRLHSLGTCYLGTLPHPPYPPIPSVTSLNSVRETQAGLRCILEQGLQILLAGPDISSRLQLQLAMRIDEIAIRRQMHGSLRFRSAQELAERLVRAGLDTGYSADLRFTMHREALRWAADARLERSYRRGDQMMRASRDSLEEAIQVAVVCLGESDPKTLALVECLRRFSPLHSV